MLSLPPSLVQSLALWYPMLVKNTQRRELAICGLASVQALASVRPQAVRRFFYTADRAYDFGSLCSVLASRRMPYRLVTPGELEKLSGTSHHQGVVAMVDDDPLEAVSDELVTSWSKGSSRIVVLDRVGDDHNLGSIARSAAFFGWTAMVIGRDSGSACLTTSAYRVARGALERIRVYSDESAARFVNRCRGCIATIGADHRGTISLGEARASSALNAGCLALVLGNEETGLSPSTRSACEHLVRVDGSGVVESLNVSQAAAVFLYELRGT